MKLARSAGVLDNQTIPQGLYNNNKERHRKDIAFINSPAGKSYFRFLSEFFLSHADGMPWSNTIYILETRGGRCIINKKSSLSLFIHRPFLFHFIMLHLSGFCFL